MLYFLRFVVITLVLKLYESATINIVIASVAQAIAPHLLYIPRLK